MPKELQIAKESAVEPSLPYPTSSRRRAKKLRAAASQPKEVTETSSHNDEIQDTAEPMEAPSKQKKKSSGKKGKVFATKDSMLSLIDQVASKEESRSNSKLKRRAEIEDMAEQRELASLESRAKKQSKLVIFLPIPCNRLFVDLAFNLC
ncbi:hypothetical protein VKS41_007351 [Umbelopsis sp. WA50703]